jgi:hypothetical protein
MRYIVESGPSVWEFGTWLLGVRKMTQNDEVEFTCREWRNNDSKGESTEKIRVHLRGMSYADSSFNDHWNITGTCRGSRVVDINYSLYDRKGVLTTRAGTFAERLLGHLQENMVRVELAGEGRMPAHAYRLAPGIIVLPHVGVQGEYLMFADAHRWDPVMPKTVLELPIPYIYMASYGAPSKVDCADVARYFIPKARPSAGQPRRVISWVMDGE